MALMLVVALMLIVNTVRVSAFSRRRETGIMRLVGASSFYIQMPFIMEAAIAGLHRRAASPAVLLVGGKYFLIDTGLSEKMQSDQLHRLGRGARQVCRWSSRSGC